MKHSLLAVLVAGGLFSGVFAAKAIAADVDFPHIETMGVSQIQVEPDMAELNVEVAVTEKEAKAAKDNSDAAVAKFIARLTAAGITKEQIQSANLNLQPQYVYAQDKAPELSGYTASRQITVTIRDLARLNTILDSALEEGINRVNNIALKSSKEAEYVAKARQAAIVDAKQKAESLVKGFGENLGKVWQIRYYDQRPVQPVMLRMNAKADAMGAAESYQYGQVTIEDRVEVVYKLK
ncbi:oxidative stress defense protein [Shewanella decolorationis]|uniref:Periplasmic protein associated with oxidative stress n=1 Tax=Shewanella decolorationis S12 TaxID=1353536 RepID=A0ABN0PL20_9GAMM|nr:oxidative stress defense protein [Shewanella decolorationis]ESE40649.1 periplasmic protein associated with oxidative stress [Shewanella decolorationis S12]GLR33074.1 oxidative stress defense protein [Shewanella decolorationis]